VARSIDPNAGLWLVDPLTAGPSTTSIRPTEHP
jgi:hypothetical protein